MNEKELKEEIEKGCGDNHSWTDIGESFFRKCNDLNKYNIEGEIIGKCKPKFCAKCRLQTIPLLKAQLKTLQKRNAEVKQAIGERIKYLKRLKKEAKERKDDEGFWRIDFGIKEILKILQRLGLSEAEE